MIDYQSYCQIRHLFTEKQLSLRQIARELRLGFHTVRKWARREHYKRAPIPKRRSKLDPFKGDIIRLLEQHEYSAQQIFQQLKELGYEGRTSILRAFVSQVRPKRRAAFLTLHFEPGQCAQVDWGGAGLGKSHLATSLAYEGCLAGHTVLFTTAIDIVNTLVAAQSAHRLKAELKKYISPSIVLVDELGYLPIDKAGADLLFQVFSQ